MCESLRHEYGRKISLNGFLSGMTSACGAGRAIFFFSAANLAQRKCFRNKGLEALLSKNLNNEIEVAQVLQKKSYDWVTSYCFWSNSIVTTIGQWSETPFLSAQLKRSGVLPGATWAGLRFAIRTESPRICAVVFPPRAALNRIMSRNDQLSSRA